MSSMPLLQSFLRMRGSSVRGLADVVSVHKRHMCSTRPKQLLQARGPWSARCSKEMKCLRQLHAETGGFRGLVSSTIDFGRHRQFCTDSNSDLAAALTFVEERG
eukprot:4430323-Pleurochrysis_carterae.AAC.1